jgi:hypothetical protein
VRFAGVATALESTTSPGNSGFQVRADAATSKKQLKIQARPPKSYPTKNARRPSYYFPPSSDLENKWYKSPTILEAYL